MGTLHWRAIALGFALALSLAVLFARVGGEVVSGLGIVTQFVAIFLGAFAAGRFAGRHGLVQGLAVAILFIIAQATLSAWADYEIVRRSGPDGLESLDLGGIVVDDLVAMIAGVAGGLLATGRDRPA